MIKVCISMKQKGVDQHWYDSRSGQTMIKQINECAMANEGLRIHI